MKSSVSFAFAWKMINWVKTFTQQGDMAANCWCEGLVLPFSSLFYGTKELKCWGLGWVLLLGRSEHLCLFVFLHRILFFCQIIEYQVGNGAIGSSSPIFPCFFVLRLLGWKNNMRGHVSVCLQTPGCKKTPSLWNHRIIWVARDLGHLVQAHHSVPHQPLSPNWFSATVCFEPSFFCI